MKKTQAHLNLLDPQTWEEKFDNSGFVISQKKDYLGNFSAIWLDILHYLSAPSLLTYRLFRKWIIFPRLSTWLYAHKIKAIIDTEDHSPGAAFFYVLKK